MPKKKKTLQDIRREEAHITALFANKLLALFQNTYRRAQKADKQSENNNKNKRISKKNQEGIKQELSLLIAFYGIGTPHRRLAEQPKLSREQLAIMDIDFDGLYFTPQQDTLSENYRQRKLAANKEYKQFSHSPSDYKLNEIPIWHEMKKFNSFRSMYRPICRQLAQIEYPPEELHSLNLSDMIDLISAHNHESTTRRMISQRTRFLQMFSKCYGDEFLKKMKILGKEPEAADFLTYISYLDKPRYQIPSKVRYAAELFNIHHVKNRKYAEELDDYSKVNDFSNLALCFTFPHHKVLHTPYEIDLNPNIIFFGSFLSELQITRNPAKERAYMQGIPKNKTNRQKSK